MDTQNLIVSLWESIKDNIPDKKRDDVATHILEVLLRYDVVEDVKDLEDALGADEHLDVAIGILVEEHDEYDDSHDFDENE